MKKIAVFLLAAALMLTACFMTSCSEKEKEANLDVTHKVELNIKNMGKITLELYGNLAPKTVENFVSLVEDGFYDGLTFHRIIPDFMIQGGDPEGTGFGGSGKAIVGEFAANGFNNTLSHDRGVISMARRGDSYNSATSQFFICHSATYKSSLDGQYAAFGRVIEGIEIVDMIAAIPTNANDKPLTDVIIESAKIIK